MAGLLTVLGLVPLLLRLPKVSVVACFDPTHPLYQWIPDSGFAPGAHCVSAPTSVVGWTLMVGVTLMIQLVVLPALFVAGAVLLRAARGLASIADRVLHAALIQLDRLALPECRPVAVPVRTAFATMARTRENPRRGPPISR